MDQVSFCRGRHCWASELNMNIRHEYRRGLGCIEVCVERCFGKRATQDL